MRTVARLFVTVLILAGASFGQCSADPVQGTNCAGPIKTTVKPGQSPTSFTDFYPATVQWPGMKAPVGFYRLCATDGHVAVDLGDGQGYLNLRGRDGVDGIDGKSSSITIGSVASGGTPLVWNSGTAQDAVLNFTLEKGDKGLQGDPGVIVGNVLTGTLICPRGKGTVQLGFISVGCTLRVLGITK